MPGYVCVPIQRDIILFPKQTSNQACKQAVYRGIHADAIVYIFPHLHTALPKEINMSDMN